MSARGEICKMPDCDTEIWFAEMRSGKFVCLEIKPDPVNGRYVIDEEGYAVPVAWKNQQAESLFTGDDGSRERPRFVCHTPKHPELRRRAS